MTLVSKYRQLKSQYDPKVVIYKRNMFVRLVTVGIQTENQFLQESLEDNLVEGEAPGKLLVSPPRPCHRVDSVG